MAAAVTETVKEALLGTEDEPQLSSQSRMDFLRHAIKDAESGEFYMTEQQFIDAIAPETEDYVSRRLFQPNPLPSAASLNLLTLC